MGKSKKFAVPVFRPRPDSAVMRPRTRPGIDAAPTPPGVEKALAEMARRGETFRNRFGS